MVAQRGEQVPSSRLREENDLGLSFSFELRSPRQPRGCSSMAELQPSKLVMPVRSRSPARDIDAGLGVDPVEERADQAQVLVPYLDERQVCRVEHDQLGL